MQKHASEDYVVLGEEPPRAGRDGSPEEPFLFSRMGPPGDGLQLDDETLEALAALMVKGSNRTSDVPAGYTYLGQFIAHDLTFAKPGHPLRATASPGQLTQLRSPTLDLDSLYGRGPDDPASARFYDADGLRLRTGSTAAAGHIPDRADSDLPRGGSGTGAERREATIPDTRNDENVAVAQTHVAFIRFHNGVVDTLVDVPAAERFDRARELVTRHYQWMIRWDYLPRVCSPGVLDDVFTNGRKAFERHAPPPDMPTMPIEFAVAAFRFGHSTIRRNYRWNDVFKDGAATLERLFAFSGTGGDLTGRDRLPSTAIADFHRLYDFHEDREPDAGAPDGINRAMRTDTAVSGPLADLPDSAFEGKPPPHDDPRRNLAYRDLTAGKRLNLATGQQMAEFLEDECGVQVSRLTQSAIVDGDPGARLGRLTQEQRAAVVRDTPLLFYILREAELNGGVLTGVGARIVAETFHRAMEGSRASIVRDADWRPSLGPEDGRFGMVDLLRFGVRGREGLLGPVR